MIQYLTKKKKKKFWKNREKYAAELFCVPSIIYDPLYLSHVSLEGHMVGWTTSRLN